MDLLYCMSWKFQDGLILVNWIIQILVMCSAVAIKYTYVYTLLLILKYSNRTFTSG